MISDKYNSYEKIAIGVLAIMSISCLGRLATGADTGGFQKVEPNKVPDELAMLADITRANYEKIKTWQAKIAFEDTIIHRGTTAAGLLKRHAGIESIEESNEVAGTLEGAIELKIDLKNNLLFKHTNWPKPMEYIDLDKGLTYTSSEQSSERTNITTNEYIIESYPDQKKKDGTILHKIARKQMRKQPQIITDDSDPRISFNIGRPVWELLSQFSDGLRSYNQGAINSFYNVVLEKAQTSKGITYRMQLTNPGASQPFEKFVLDGERGFNPTHIEVKNDKGITISEITTDFNEIGGIFLPSERHVIQYDGDDGRLRREAKSTFSDMKVNMTLPENTFSINNLGLKDGDKFIDKIAGKEYRYQDANLVLIAEPNK